MRRKILSRSEFSFEDGLGKFRSLLEGCAGERYILAVDASLDGSDAVDRLRVLAAEFDVPVVLNAGAPRRGLCYLIPVGDLDGD